MSSHGLSRWIRVLPGDYTELSGAAAARQLTADMTLPTAVIAGNDQCAAPHLVIRGSTGPAAD